MAYGTNLTNLKVTVDVSGLRGIATLKPRAGNCTSAGQLITCVEPSPVNTTLDEFLAEAVSGATPGAVGTYTVTATADGVGTATDTGTLAVPDGVDLVVTSPKTENVPAKPGQTVFAKMSFINAGNRAASGTSVQMSFDMDLVPVQYEGCTYTFVDLLGTTVTCPSDKPLAAGEEVTFVSVDDNGTETEGVAATVDRDAIGAKMVHFTAVSAGVAASLTKSPSALAKKATSGQKYKVVKTARMRANAVSEINPYDNNGHSGWKVASTYDVAALGSTARGDVGDVVQLSVGVRNNGPGSIDNRDAGNDWYFTFTLPEGVELVDGWHPCENASMPDGRTYRCTIVDNLNHPYFGAGAQIKLAFPVRITKVVPDASGSVVFHGQYADANPSNNQAMIVINPTATTGGGELPVTGAQIGGIVAGGATLLGAGIALFVVGRRRRVRLLTPGGRIVE